MKMTSRELAVVAVKVFAIYVLVRAVLLVPTTLLSLFSVGFRHASDDINLYLFAISTVSISILATFAVGIMLWRHSDKILSGSDGKEPAIDAGELEPIVLSALGIFLSVQGLVRLANLGAAVYIMSRGMEQVRGESIAQLIAYLFQVIIGISLVIGSKGWPRCFNGCDMAVWKIDCQRISERNK